MADATLRFLTDAAFQRETRHKAYRYARPMFWSNVGQRYLNLFARVASINAGMERLYRKAFPLPGDGLEFAELAKEGL